MRRPEARAAVRVAALAAAMLACVSGPATTGETPGDPARAALGEAPPVPQSACPRAVADEAPPLRDLPAAARAPRKIAPRGSSPVLVPGRDEVAYVDRATGEAHVVALAGGAPRRLSPSRSAPPSDDDLRATGRDPRARLPEPVSVVYPGPRDGEITYLSGQEHFTVATREGAPPPVRTDGERLHPEGRRREAFGAALARHGLGSREHLVPLSETLAVVVGDGAPLPAGLHALDTVTGTLRRVSPPALPIDWAPTRIDDRHVLFGAGGHHFLLDAAEPRLTCATAAKPEGFRPGPWAISPDRASLAYGAYREVPQGWELLVALSDLRAGEERLVAHAGLVTGVSVEAVPGRAGFVVVVHRGGTGDVLLLEPGGAVVRLATAVPGIGRLSAGERAIVFAREAPTTEIVPSERPPEQRRDPRMGCDPVPPMGGCGWVSNGCDYVFLGPCVRRIAPPDPADGIYAIDW